MTGGERERRERRGAARVTVMVVAASVHCGSQASLGGSDQDGVQGGDYTFALTVTDLAFAPTTIFWTQNNASVTLTLTNAGSTPHDFVLRCRGSACFSGASTVSPLLPGASTTVQFTTPNAEGIYEFVSDLPGDTQKGQFIVQ